MNEFMEWAFAPIDWAWWRFFLTAFCLGGILGVYVMVAILRFGKAAKRGDDMHAQALLAERLKNKTLENDELKRRIQILEARLERTTSEGARASAKLLDVEVIGGVQ